MRAVRSRHPFQSIEIIEIGASVGFDVTQGNKFPKYLIHFNAMSVLSKYFQEAIASATCRDIVHPHTDSCFQAARGYFFKVSLPEIHITIYMFSSH